MLHIISIEILISYLNEIYGKTQMASNTFSLNTSTYLKKLI